MIYSGNRIAESISEGEVSSGARASRRALEAEIAALLAAGVAPALVADAVREAQRTGVSPDTALLASRRVNEDDFYRAVAQRLGAPFLSQAVSLDADQDYAVAAHAGFAALSHATRGVRVLAAPRGRALAALLAGRGAAGVAITTPRRFDALLRNAAAARIADDAAMRLHRAEPRLSARNGPARPTRFCVAAFAAVVSALAFFWPPVAWLLAWTFLTFAFSAATIVRIFTAAASFDADEQCSPLADWSLPAYTIVVALYREAGVVGELMRALEALDYPRAKLDIKFVVEADDPETFAALAAILPGVEYEIIVAPPGAPRTKPRALNVALPFSRGRLLTVYDAEDRPERDQLRRAAARFARADAMLGCLQARLSIDNADDNWLTGLFAIDYAALFDVANPGLAALGLPMLLGGTSNHFRTQALHDVCGWDAWNVTEDADLGVRLARCGYRVEMLDSRTYEEAPITLRALLNQRVRWMKGWMQTAYVQLRNPLALLRNLGPLPFVATLSAFVAGVLSPLLWPLFTLLLAHDLWSGALFAPATVFDGLVDACALWLALAGPVAMVWPALLGMERQGLSARWPLLFLLPLWHVMLSVAAWCAVVDLCRNPFGWAKTTHGVARRRIARGG